MPSRMRINGRGVGTRLLEQLATRAAGHGIERFIGEVMADNAAMIRVFEGVGFEVARTLAGGEVEMTFPIAATAGYVSRVAERDHTAVVASLRPFFEARSVVVVGRSVAVEHVSAGAPTGAEAPTAIPGMRECEVHDRSAGARLMVSGVLRPSWPWRGGSPARF